MKPSNVPPITRFAGPYLFLSNFYPVKVKHENLVYPSAEHAYQASKTRKIGVRRHIQTLNAYNAKRVGRNISISPGWNHRRLAIMEEILRSKFSTPTMRQLLIDTYPRDLIESNTWHDTFWGIYNGYGENNLGKLLMKIREEYR